jgi:two-component system, LytTR family, response regulator
MKALIIDDERLARQELRHLLQPFTEIEVVDEAQNADDALQKIDQYQPDLIFLDIQMPGKSGFEMLELLDKVPMVIFTTAYDEYAIRAFEVSAIDYLLKPINQERLAESIKKIHEHKAAMDAQQSEAPQSRLSAEDRVFVKDGERCWFVKLSDIRLFESEGNYVRVYFDRFKPLIHRSLNALDERLDEKAFFRASRKHILNLHWVEAIEPYFNGGLIVTLKGGEKVEISRRQAARFKDMMSL